MGSSLMTRKLLRSFSSPISSKLNLPKFPWKLERTNEGHLGPGMFLLCCTGSWFLNTAAVQRISGCAYIHSAFKQQFKTKKKIFKEICKKNSSFYRSIKSFINNLSSRVHINKIARWQEKAWGKGASQSRRGKFYGLLACCCAVTLNRWDWPLTNAAALCGNVEAGSDLPQ